MTDDQEFVFAPIHATYVVNEGAETYEEALTPACDFCLDSRLMWEYPCETFLIEEIDFGSDGEWLACERCSDRIEARDFGGLTARTLKSWTLRIGAPQPGMVDAIGQIQQGFFDHRIGPRTPYG